METPGYRAPNIHHLYIPHEVVQEVIPGHPAPNALAVDPKRDGQGANGQEAGA